MDFHRHPKRLFRHILGAPVIYSILLPVVIMDLWVEIYHRICFPLYGLKYISRSAYIRIDRQKLSYLSWTEKINCMYCGYVNGFLHYSSAIAGATEKYWCGIKHKKGDGFIEPNHHAEFIDYNDKEAYMKNKERPASQNAL